MKKGMEEMKEMNVTNNQGGLKMKQYKEKLTLELAEKLLTQKLGKEFYNELRNLVTARYEADYFLDYLLNKFDDDFEDYENFDSFVKHALEDYIDGYLTVDKYLWNFCSICKQHWGEIDCGHYTASRIKYYRLKNGWSIRDLAEKLGENYSTVVAWESGRKRKKPNLESLKKLGDVFGVSYLCFVY